jgi:hypothetical protein
VAKGTDKDDENRFLPQTPNVNVLTMAMAPHLHTPSSPPKDTSS